MRFYIAVFAAAFGAALFITPVIRRLAIYLEAVDMPHSEKLHERITPTSGGLAIFLAFLASLIVAKIAVAFGIVSEPPLNVDQALNSTELIGIVISAAFIMIVGILDDVMAMSAVWKLIGQITSVMMLMSFGVRMSHISIMGFTLDFSGSLLTSYLVTMVWMLSFINIMNLIDGLDGLACGIGVIAALSFFIYGFRVGADVNIVQAMLLSMALAGACSGFLPYNFNPASIFMGDTGSMSIGFILGAISIQGIVKRTALFTMITPVIVLLIPVYDTFMAILRRMKRRQPVFQGDTEHIHHMLLELGHSHKEAVLLIYFWTGMFSAAVLTWEFVPSRAVSTVIMGIAVSSLLGFLIFHYVKNKISFGSLSEADKEEEAEADRLN